MATTLDLTFVGVVVALLAVIAGWFMTQKKPEKVAAPPPKDVPEPEAKTVKPSKAGLPAKKTQLKVGAHPNMLCAFKGHTGEHSHTLLPRKIPARSRGPLPQKSLLLEQPRPGSKKGHSVRGPS